MPFIEINHFTQLYYIFKMTKKKQPIVVGSNKYHIDESICEKEIFENRKLQTFD